MRKRLYEIIELSHDNDRVSSIYDILRGRDRSIETVSFYCLSFSKNFESISTNSSCLAHIVGKLLLKTWEPFICLNCHNK